MRHRLMHCHEHSSRLQVYEKLATVASWNNWHTSAWVLKSPNVEKLGPGDKFAYTAPFVLGNVHSQVEESAQDKVDTYTIRNESSHCASLCTLLSCTHEHELLLSTV